MMCLDWTDKDPIEIMGNAESETNVALDIGLVPCNVKLYEGDVIDSQCVGEKEA